jgi:hypothetical protein
MAVRIPDSFAARAPRAAPSPRLAPVTDLGFGRLGQTLGGVASGMQAEAARERAMADADARQMKRDAEVEAKLAQREADTLDLFGRAQKFSEAATARFVGDVESGAAAAGGYLEAFAADLDRDIAQAVAAAPEHLRTRLELDLKQARASALAQHRSTVTQARVAAQTQAAEGTLDSIVNETRIAPGKMSDSLAKVDALIDAMAVPDAAKNALRPAYRAQVTAAALEARVQTNPTGVKRDVQAGAFNGLLRPEQLDRVIDQADARLEELAREAQARARQAEQDRRERVIAAERAAAIREARRNEAARHAKEMQALDRAIRSPGVEAGMQDTLMSLSLSGRAASNGPSLATVREVLGPEAASRFELALGAATRTYAATVGFERLTGRQMAERVAALRPKAGQANYASALEIFRGAQAKAEALATARATDPVGHWRSTDLFREAVEGTMRTPTFRGRPRAEAEQAVLRHLQRNYGGAPDGRPRVLSRADALELAQRLKPTSGERGARTAVETLQRLRQTYGPAGTSLALADIADAGGARELTGLAAVTSGAQARAAELLFAPLPAAPATKDKRAIRAELTARLAPLAATHRAGGGARGAIDAILGAGEKLVATLEADGMARKDAVEEVGAMFTGDHQLRDGLRFPLTVRPMVASTSAALARERLLSDPAMLAPRGGPPGLPPRERQRAYASELRANSRWINLADDSGLMLVDRNNRPVIDAQGRPVRRTWNELRLGPVSATTPAR